MSVYAQSLGRDMRQTAIGFESKKLKLEGVLTLPQGLAGPFPSLVVCHPHPVLGGDMENPVVMAICRAADRRGLATLRFNFRGVGDSEGEFSNGAGERQDLEAALKVVRRWPGLDRRRIALAGYSFGASVALGGLRRCGAACSLAFVAPPIASVRESRIANDKRPKLFVVGQNDRIAPPVSLQSALDDVRQPLRFAEVPAADHSLQGHEREVGELVAGFAADTLGVAG